MLRGASAALCATALAGCPSPSTPAAAPTGQAKAAPAAAASPAAPRRVTLRGRTMGTTYTVAFVPPAGMDAAAEARVQPAVDATLAAVNQVMSTYIPDSAISVFNAHERTAAVATAPELVALVQRAVKMHGATEGAFDITLGPLIDAWGFDKSGRRTSAPDAAVLAAAKAAVGADKLVVDAAAHTLAKTAPGVQINLSAMAKGHGVDLVVATLKKHGVTSAMVEVGGEVRVLGEKAPGQPWRLGINVPDATAPATAVFRVVPLPAGRALATSGSYRNYFEQDGVRYSHILDPRTARPIQHRVVSASIVAEDCATADAWATAAMVLGVKDTLRLVDGAKGVDALLIERSADGMLKAHATPGFPAAP